mgnify:FL=1
MISSVIDWLVNLIEVIGYPGVAIAMFIESFFAPIPSEIILPFSGFVAFGGSLNIYVVIVVATLAAYLGTLPFYFIGRWGNEFVMEFLKKYGKYLFISQDDLQKGFDAFEKYGIGIVFFGRLVPIVRTVISFPAGVSRMNFLQFSIYTLVGAGIWSSILASAGFFFGDRWDMVSVYVERYENVILILLLVVVAVYIGWNIRKVLRKSN